MWNNQQQNFPQNYGQVGASFSSSGGNSSSRGYSPATPRQGQMGYAPSMGGPPQGYQQGYDNSSPGTPRGYQQGGAPMAAPRGWDPQSFAFQQAEADLEKLEHRQSKREKRRDAKEVDHLVNKRLAGSRDQKDNQACARTLCMWSVFNGLMYGLALMGDSWTVNKWHAMSIDEMTITLGLFNLDVYVKCKDAVDMKLCNMMKPWADHNGGLWATQELRENMCGKDKGTCWTVDRIYFGGWIPLILLPAAAAFQCLSLMSLYFYWHVNPSSMLRIISSKCSALALFCSFVGFCGWFTIRPWMSGVPRMWAEMAGQKGASADVLTGFKETWCMSVGWNLVCAVLGMFGNFGCLFSQMGMDYHVDELDPYGIDENSALLQQAKSEAEAYQTNRRETAQWRPPSRT